MHSIMEASCGKTRGMTTTTTLTIRTDLSIRRRIAARPVHPCGLDHRRRRRADERQGGHGVPLPCRAGWGPRFLCGKGLPRPHAPHLSQRRRLPGGARPRLRAARGARATGLRQPLALRARDRANGVGGRRVRDARYPSRGGSARATALHARRKRDPDGVFRGRRRPRTPAASSRPSTWRRRPRCFAACWTASPFGSATAASTPTFPRTTCSSGRGRSPS